MKRISRTFALLLLGVILGLPLGIYLVQYKFINKEKAIGMVNEEALLDDFAKNEYIEFADASAGQQATALLTVLLNQRGAPLIIDQPEDDVDSKMSPEIVRQIWNAKRVRQLICASHNANFVVNGDGELVICCDYVRAGDQTGGQIKATGAIDSGMIKDEITAVTEGGKEAFKLRKEKYGF